MGKRADDVAFFWITLEFIRIGTGEMSPETRFAYLWRMQHQLWGEMLSHSLWCQECRGDGEGI